MNEMYTGMDMQRTRPLTDWLMLDSLVKEEFTGLGGKVNKNYTIKIKTKQQ